MKYFFFMFFVVLVMMVFVVSVGNPPKIEKGDIVKKCVIDTMYVTQSPSTIEFGKRYHYKTSCDEVILTKRNDVYKIGDTITYVYKKR